VVAGPTWSIDASREIIEMLVDPSGNRLHVAPAIEIKHDGAGDVPGELAYLVEACSPCTDVYSIDGYPVSDFVTPHYYDGHAQRFSFTGAITRPRQLEGGGGYLSYLDVDSDVIKQIRPPELVELGSAEGNCLRTFVDANTPPAHRGVPAKVAMQRKPLAAAARAHARKYL
jgi:hypothetical protein